MTTETQTKTRKRWLDGSRSQQPQGRWLVLGPMDEASANDLNGRGYNLKPTTAKTLVRGEKRANEMAQCLGRQALPTDDPTIYLIDHGTEVARRQRVANR